MIHGATLGSGRTLDTARCATTTGAQCTIYIDIYYLQTITILKSVDSKNMKINEEHKTIIKLNVHYFVSDYENIKCAFITQRYLLFRFVLLLTRNRRIKKSKKIKTNKYYISVFNFKVLYKTLPLSKKLISVWSQKSGVRMPLFTFCTFYPSNN